LEKKFLRLKKEGGEEAAFMVFNFCAAGLFINQIIIYVFGSILLLVVYVVTLDIRLPKPVAELIKRDPVLRRLVEQVAEKSVRDMLIEIFGLDQLLSSSRLTEKDVAELDKIIKAMAREKLRKYVDSGGHE